MELFPKEDGSNAEQNETYSLLEASPGDRGNGTTPLLLRGSHRWRWSSGCTEDQAALEFSKRCLGFDYSGLEVCAGQREFLKDLQS